MEGKSKELIIKDVLYCAHLRRNLLSVNKLIEDGIKVDFSKERVHALVNNKIMFTA